jgi:hypothetical protein
MIMKLWLLRANEGNECWEPWFDKTFGMVVRARNELEARSIAAENADNERMIAWLSTENSSCVELTRQGKSELIIRDNHAA